MSIISSRIVAADRVEAVFEKMQRIIKKFLHKPLYNYGYIPGDREISLSVARRKLLSLISPFSKTARCITDISLSVLKMDGSVREKNSVEGNHFSFAERLFNKSPV